MADEKGKKSSVRRWALAVCYALLIVVTLILLFAERSSSEAGFLENAGKGAARLGLAIVLLQVVLASRNKSIDRAFGIDKAMWLHRFMAVAAVVLLLLHPVLLSASYRSLALFSFKTGWQVMLGKAALFIVVAGTLVAVGFKKLRVPYQTWRFMHKGMICVGAVGVAHALTVGSFALPTKVYLCALLAVTVCVFLFRNVLAAKLGRRRFTVAAVTRETHNTYTLAFEPIDKGALVYQPGQFMFLKLLRQGMSSEEHPFTISSSPTREGQLTATIKQVGDFTNTIDQTKPGDQALIEAPFGRFSFVHDQPDKLVFIAGGVGITPLMSMLRFLADTGDTRPVLLIYGNRTEEDIIFRDELASLPEHIRVVHILSSAGAEWDGPRGFVDETAIREHAGEMLSETHVYVCGPPPMMASVIRSLRALGVKRGRIHYERFAI